MDNNTDTLPQEMQGLQTQIDVLSQSLSKTVKTPSRPVAPVIPTGLPQGNGSNLNADKVDGINASYIPMPNTLLPLGPNGKFPTTIVPIAGGGGSGLLLGNGAPTDKNLLIADGTLWQSRVASGDITVTADTGTFQVIGIGNITTGTLGPTHGGTGLATYTTGDTLYASASNVLSKRAIGTSGQVLTVSGGIPVWATPSTSGPAGITGDIQFNTSGAFAADAGLFWDNTAKLLHLSGSTGYPSFQVDTNGHRMEFNDGTISNTPILQFGLNNNFQSFVGAAAYFAASCYTDPLDVGMQWATRTGGVETARMCIKGTGEVGIGTQTPTHALEVVGNVTATSFSGDGSALTGLNASNLASGIVASARISGSYTGITGVGTLTAGTWNATKVDLAYGGTNADLSATGGAAQVLKQVSSGAAITVGTVNLGDLSTSIVTKTGNYTITLNDNYVLSNGVNTITLPTAVGISGRLFTIKGINVGGGTIVATTSSQTIDGSTTQVLVSQFASITVISDGANWWIV